jgi:hypothetical protein
VSSAWSTPSVLEIRLARITNAQTHALELAADMLFVEWSIIVRFAHVAVVIAEILLKSVDLKVSLGLFNVSKCMLHL